MKFSLGLILAFFLPLHFAIAASASRFPTSRREISPSFRPSDGKKVRIAFFDADSTLRVAPSGSVSANGPKDVAVLPMLREKLRELESQGFLLAIVSNQAGVQKGYVTAKDAEAALAFTISELGQRGIRFHYFDFAENEDENRKPGLGMAERLAALVEAKFGVGVDWAGSFVVGDSGWKKGVDLEPDGTPGEDFSNTDRLFAENLAKKHPGVVFHHPRDFFSWKKVGIRNFPDYESLKSFVISHPRIK